MNNQPIVEGRSCDGCTKCCEGYLAGDIRNQYMGMLPDGSIKPCFFVEIGKGCKDYENRPYDPCSTFKCDYLTNPDIPESFKPSRSQAIIITRTVNGQKYTKIIEAGRKLDSEVLSWARSYALVNELNLAWSVLENMFWIGSAEFDQMMDKDYPLIQSDT